MVQFIPGSLGITGATIESSISNSDAVYFGFVALASLGYGYIVPVSEPSRGLTVIKVIGGQFYLAVLVARLVGVVRRGVSRNQVLNRLRENADLPSQFTPSGRLREALQLSSSKWRFAPIRFASPITLKFGRGERI